MAEFEDKMVLRTVYLPFELDQELRSIAFRDNRSKNDLIRELIKTGIDAAKEGDDRRFKFVAPARDTSSHDKDRTSTSQGQGRLRWGPCQCIRSLFSQIGATRDGRSRSRGS